LLAYIPDSNVLCVPQKNMQFLTNRSALAFGEQLFPRVFLLTQNLNLAIDVLEPHKVSHIFFALNLRGLEI